MKHPAYFNGPTRFANGMTYELIFNLATSRYGWVSCEGKVLGWFADLEDALLPANFDKLTQIVVSA